MAKVRNNLLISGLSGSIGNLVIRQMPDGGTWVSKAPDFSSRKFSKGQLAHQSRFQEAVAYARQAAKTQPIYAQLAAGTIKSAYNFALSDWFNPPVIHRIESKNGHIRVQASDNVLVTRVSVTILDHQGKVLELAEAIEAEELWWEYVSAAAGKTIVIEARDLAGNVTRAEAEQFQ
jgi:hypothetical protein